MIDKFEVGCYYRWTGPKWRPIFFNNEGFMDAVLDGKRHLCIGVKRECHAMFEDTKFEGWSTWYWGGVMHHFEKVSIQVQLELF